MLLARGREGHLRPLPGGGGQSGGMTIGQEDIADVSLSLSLPQRQEDTPAGALLTTHSSARVGGEDMNH